MIRRLQAALFGMVVAGLLLRLGAWAVDPLVQVLGYVVVAVTVVALMVPRHR